MKSRCLPLWLLRDVPALLGVMISFWPLMILVIRNGFAVMRGRHVSMTIFDQIPILLAHAEARLDFALWREAYRRLGWNHRRVRFSVFTPPLGWPETEQRFESYRRANMNLEACARAYVEELRQRYRISQRDAANAGSCPLRHATASRATSPGYADGGKTHRSFSSSGALRRGMWHALARDGGGSHSSRGPPAFARRNPLALPQRPARLRPHPHAPTSASLTQASACRY